MNQATAGWPRFAWKTSADWCKHVSVSGRRFPREPGSPATAWFISFMCRMCLSKVNSTATTFRVWSAAHSCQCGWRASHTRRSVVATTTATFRSRCVGCSATRTSACTRAARWPSTDEMRLIADVSSTTFAPSVTYCGSYTRSGMWSGPADIENISVAWKHFCPACPVISWDHLHHLLQLTLVPLPYPGFHFYRTSYAGTVLGVIILSVRPSVCLSHSCFVTNPKNRPAIFFISYERAIILVFCCQRSQRNSNGSPSTGATKRGGYVKTAIFDQYLAISHKRCAVNLVCRRVS